MNKKTKQELIDEGYTVYSEDEAREIICDEVFEGLVYDIHDYKDEWMWNVVKLGFKGVNDWTLKDIEDYFAEYDWIALEWQLEEQQ